MTADEYVEPDEAKPTNASVLSNAKSGFVGSPESEMLIKLDRLLDQQRTVVEIRPTGKKDFWDKVQAAGLVGFLGILLTLMLQNTARRQQDALKANELAQAEKTRQDNVRMQELQLVTALLPIFASDDEQKKELAITALSELGSPRLAAMIATLRPSVGTAAGLQALRFSSHISDADRALVDTALQSLPVPLRNVRGPLSSAEFKPSWIPRRDSISLLMPLTGLPNQPRDLTGLQQYWEDAYGNSFVSGRCVQFPCARIMVLPAEVSPD